MMYGACSPCPMGMNRSEYNCHFNQTDGTAAYCTVFVFSVQYEQLPLNRYIPKQKVKMAFCLFPVLFSFLSFVWKCVVSLKEYAVAGFDFHGCLIVQNKHSFWMNDQMKWWFTNWQPVLVACVNNWTYRCSQVGACVFMCSH